MSARRSHGPPALRSGAVYGAPNRRDHANLLERPRHTQPGEPRFVHGQQHVSRMQRAVKDVRDRAEVERSAQLRGDANRVCRRDGPYPRTARSSDSAAT